MSAQRAPSFDRSRMIGDTCLCLDVQRASRAIGRRFDEAFRPLGLNNWQFSLLMALNRPTPPTMSSLAECLAMDRTTTTANLRPLERRGFVEVRRDEQDARGGRISKTRVATSVRPIGDLNSPCRSTGQMLSVEATYEIAETCLCLHVQTAGRVVARHVDHVFRPRLSR